MLAGMQRLFWFLGLALAALARAAEPAADPLELQVADLVAGPQVTVVHFWAPWCPNCRAELDPTTGWAKFINDNPGVKVVFMNVWHKGQDPAPRLAAAGLGAQPNLLLLTHPNPSRLAADRLNKFLGLPLTWIPTTWVYREGKLRVAFNYGEIRFPVLQQMVDDARNEWSH
jgi:thiol-disulfide isomerase/thioredoxin